MHVFYENKSDTFHFNYGTKLEFAPHLHYHIELVYMLEGYAGYIVDGEKDEIRAGDIFITFPNQIHQYQRIGTEKYMIFIFSPDILPEIKDIFKNKLPESSVIKNAALNKKLPFLLTAIAEESTKQSQFQKTIITGYFLAFFGELFNIMTLRKNNTSNLSILKDLLNYCTQNYTKEISLGTVAQNLYVSKYYISHLFSEKLNVSFNDYINALRISDACRYLKSEMSITEISQAVGFNTQRTFNRAFIRHAGMTPGEYARKQE